MMRIWNAVLLLLQAYSSLKDGVLTNEEAFRLAESVSKVLTSFIDADSGSSSTDPDGGASQEVATGKTLSETVA